MKLTSFGDSGFLCYGSRFTFRRAVRMFLAARKRWPNGRLAYQHGGIGWMWRSENDRMIMGVMISR